VDSSGWRPPTGWNHRYVEATVGIDDFIYSQGGTFLQEGPIAAGLFTQERIAAFPQWMIDSANSRALLSLKGQGENVSVDIAEYRQTCDMFAHHTSAIARQVKDYRYADKTRWQRVLSEGLKRGRNIPQSWLELQYGWLPLMSDVLGAATDLSDLSAGKAFRKVVKGSVGNNSVEHYDLPIGISNGVCRLEWQLRKSATTKLYFSLANPTLAALSTLGLTNPLDLAWETLKYSFVVDWFLPIGNWLQTFDATLGWDFIGGYTSTIQRANSVTYLLPGGGVTGVVNGSGRFTDFKRIVYASPPGAGLPHFKNPLSAKHVANALSLLVQAFR